MGTALQSNVVTSGYPIRRKYPLKAATEVQVGDFLWWDSTNATVKSVGGVAGNLVRTWSSESRARRDAVARFIGIAAFQHGTVDNADKIVVSTNCFARVAVASATYKHGDLLTFYKDAGGNYLYRGALQKTINPREAIAVVAGTYSSAVTEVEAFITGAYDMNPLGNLVRSVQFTQDGTAFGAAGSTAVLTGYTWDENVRVFAAQATVQTATTSADQIYTIKNAANALDDTLTIPVSSICGAIINAAIDDASGYHDFLHDDAMNVTSDAAAVAGSATIKVLAYVKPVL